MSACSDFLLHIVVLYCASFSLSLSTPTAPSIQTDKLSLQAFKSQLTESSQKALSSWNDSLHICNWEGVTCGRRHQRVTELDFDSKGLEGPISPHIGNLSFLWWFELYNNSFHGNIPPQLGQLFRLEYLGLSLNSLEGEIPANISLCSNLRDFRATDNKLIGKIPTEFGFLPNLVFLNLDTNKLLGGIPPSIGNITSLETLFISYNNLGGSIPSTLHQLKNLMFLSLESCNLSGRFPYSLFNLSSLRTISIPHNSLSGDLPSVIGVTLPNLKTFRIWENKFSGHIPTSLFNISGFEKIEMDTNHFIGKIPHNFENLPKLITFNLFTNNLGSGKSGDSDFITSQRKSGDLDFINPLTNCSRLEYFNVANNKLAGVLPPSIANFSSKVKIHLGYNQIFGNIPTGIENVQGLTYLNLESNFISGSVPAGIGKLQKLGILHLSGNQLSGHIPSSIGNMSHLFDLDLSDNNLEGSITSALGNQNLQFLDLSYNYLIGSVTIRDTEASSQLVKLYVSFSVTIRDTEASSQLVKLYVSFNSLNGSLDVGNLMHLNILDLSHNKMSGEIPSTLGSCSSLSYLSFQDNYFNGSIPSSLSSLKALEDLDLSNNNISGEIPKELRKLSFLRHLNLSFNNLEGEVPVEGVFANVNAFSVIGNHKICGGISKLGLRKCQTGKSKKKRSSYAFKVVLGVFIPSLIAVLAFAIYFRRKPKAKPPLDLNMGELRRVSYRDLHRATSAFSPTNLIGTGRYGYVYKGILQQDEHPSAIKVLNLIEHGAAKSFVAECEALRRVHHRNLLKILTVCSSTDFNGNDFKALVFEFMPNGSLENWLYPSPNGGPMTRSLNLHQRLEIAFDVASALDYLHNAYDEPIVHCDLKPSNVLLSEDMTAHVSDFGLAKFLSASTNIANETESKSIAIRGTIGYIPPEYGMGAEVSTEGDIYSYGLLLLELFTGKRPTDEMFKNGLNLHNFCKAALPLQAMDIVDTSLSYKSTQNGSVASRNRINECLNAIVGIGVACSIEPMHERMDIKQVLNEIRSIKEQLCT